MTMLAQHLFQSVWVLGYTEPMPTILRVDGLRIVVYPNDHRPAHVQVIGGHGEA
jgi:hypothetical protein